MIYGMLRVRDESRWIGRVIKSIQPVCQKIVVMDDHSVDQTPMICAELGCIVFQSTFEGTDESRDKNTLLSHLWASGAEVGDFVLAIDGDEILNQPDIPRLLALSANPNRSYSFKVEYLWNSENQLRVDRLYSSFYRASFFPLTSHSLAFSSTGYGGNFHCGNVPSGVQTQMERVDVHLLHLGYLHREDRVRKWHFYNDLDPGNTHEAQYEHMVLGDLPQFPAMMISKWAGPLELAPSPFQIIS